MKRRLVLFAGAALVGLISTSGFFWATAEQPAQPPLSGRWLTERLFVREQMTPADIPAAARQGFTTIVDLRPDGEAPDQPSSAVMAGAVKAPMSFRYIPVSPGAIPAEAVSKLGELLHQQEGPVLLYCRSGSRAARTWALAEASRSGGLDAESIVNMVQQAGFTAADLKGDITARIAARAKN